MPPTASQSSSSVLKLDDKSPLAMLLDIKKESEALEISFEGDTVSNRYQILVQIMSIMVNLLGMSA